VVADQQFAFLVSTWISTRSSGLPTLGRIAAQIHVSVVELVLKIEVRSLAELRAIQKSSESDCQFPVGRPTAQNLVCRPRHISFSMASIELRQHQKDIIMNLLQEVIDAASDSLAEDL
jgi:hypothetical protein